MDKLEQIFAEWEILKTKFRDTINELKEEYLIIKSIDDELQDERMKEEYFLEEYFLEEYDRHKRDFEESEFPF